LRDNHLLPLLEKKKREKNKKKKKKKGISLSFSLCLSLFSSYKNTNPTPSIIGKERVSFFYKKKFASFPNHALERLRSSTLMPSHSQFAPEGNKGTSMT
jgi:hypothetical protein